MRFDLEFNVTEQLTKTGLSLLAETLYSEDKESSSILTPAKWDNLAPISSLQKNKGIIDTSKFKGLNLPSWLYVSGVATENDILIDKVILRNNLICPTFIAGSIYLYKHKYEWSNNLISKYFQINENNLYYCDIDSDIDIDTVEIFTMRLEYPGYLIKEKIFEFIEYDGISIESTFKKLSMSEYLWTLNNNKIYLNSKVISYTDHWLGTATPGSSSLMALPEFPVMERDGQSEVLISNPFSSDDVRVMTSIVLVASKEDVDIPVYGTYNVTPLITYKQKTRSFNSDIMWKNINLTPSAISFSDGLLCLYNVFGTAGGAVRTCDGATILMPIKITIEKSEDSLRILDSIKITASVTGIDNVPIRNANIRFELGSSNTDAVFLENNMNTIEARTGLDGKVDVNIIINAMKFGFYIQKEWIKNTETTGEIRVPYSLPIDSDDPVYLYFVTQDDPILGKRGAQEYLKYHVIDQWQRLREGEVENPLVEYYLQKGKIESYFLNGRKIAWVKMQASNDGEQNTLKSSYIKPSLITPSMAFTTRVRDLFIKGTKETLTSTATNISFGATSKYPVLGYRAGVLPEDGYMKTSIVSTNDGYSIMYNQPIPAGEEIAGYWLVTGIGGHLDVQAFLEDKCSLISLASDIEQVEIKNYIKSESEFILSNTELENYNTALNGFSYYTVSEYINNPFHINSASYGCKYSDCIYLDCLHPRTGMKVHYLKSDDCFCKHTPEFDSGKPWSQTCPVQSKYMKDEDGNIILDENSEPVSNPYFELGAASFVNPFVLHIDKNS
jgi:hypothetical protein